MEPKSASLSTHKGSLKSVDFIKKKKKIKSLDVSMINKM